MGLSVMSELTTQNLQIILQECLLKGDFETGAAVAEVLLESQVILQL
jgi:hypothetical protein